MQQRCLARIRPIVLNRASFEVYKSLMEAERLDISVLLNAPGFGLFGKFTHKLCDEDPVQAEDKINLNLFAV